MITATNEDNMLMMARYPDDYFELAIVDPPYGINVTKMTLGNGKKKINKGNSDWDSKTPDLKYFKELRRVSKNQVIWGANYMTENLPPSMGWIYWDKGTGLNDFSDGELAYTSFNRALRSYKVGWVGANAKDKDGRFHPTQKPVKLYEWILMNYAKEGDKIIDTHRGSASLDIACHNLGFDLVTCELDTDYFNDGNKRLKQHQNQQVMKF
jgi:site-specific DNA-methyltransferase (adenine-specific)